MISEKNSILDISPELSAELAVWPGDTPLTREVLCDIGTGANIDLSTLHSTVHLGAHADAPRHYSNKGLTIESVDLHKYMGLCQVIHVPMVPLILPEHFEPLLNSNIPRVLFRTDSYPDPKIFNKDFTAFHPSSLTLLGEKKTKLIGIDTPSIDPFHSKDLPSHQEILRYGIANLEGLILSHVRPGVYELIALPLKLKGFDASPVRAILLEV